MTKFPSNSPHRVKLFRLPPWWKISNLYLSSKKVWKKDSSILKALFGIFGQSAFRFKEQVDNLSNESFAARWKIPIETIMEDIKPTGMEKNVSEHRDKSILKPLYITFGLSGFRRQDKKKGCLIGSYSKGKVFDWDLHGVDQNGTYGEARIRRSRRIYIGRIRIPLQGRKSMTFNRILQRNWVASDGKLREKNQVTCLGKKLDWKPIRVHVKNFSGISGLSGLQWGKGIESFQIHCSSKSRSFPIATLPERSRPVNMQKYGFD